MVGMGRCLYTIWSIKNSLPDEWTASNGMFMVEHYVARTTVVTTSFALRLIRVALRRYKRECGTRDKTSDSWWLQAPLFVEFCGPFNESHIDSYQAVKLTALTC